MLIDQILELRARALERLSQIESEAEFEQLRVEMLGKKGQLTAFLRGLGTLPADERPAMGQRINELRQEFETAFEERIIRLREAVRQARLQSETLDVTMPVPFSRVGSLHPVTLTMNRMIEIFVGLGFTVAEGPEIEFDRFNFELMNMPKNHPARDMQDTFYFTPDLLLRTHTSPVQARTMLAQKPPIRIVCPGRAFRADEPDNTHSPNFHQLEGLVVDEGIHMGHLKGTLDAFVRAFYGEEFSTRFRPSFFPFTEPSAEVDLTCAACKGKGCRICKGTGWIEVLGAGMVNPRVLEMCGIDPERYTGFAFGMGIERIANIKYNIPDMRSLYENDLRFLSQFR